MLMLIKVPRGSIEEEMVSVCRELEAQPSPAYIPHLFLKLGLATIRMAEQTFNLDCGPTVGSEAAFIARSRASEDKRAIAGWQDMRSAIHTTVYNSGRLHKKNISEVSLDALLPDLAVFLQREFSDINLSLLIKNCCSSLGTTAEITAADVKKLLTNNSTDPQLEQFSACVIQMETIDDLSVYALSAEYLQAYRSGIARLKKARGRMSKSCV